VNAAPIFADNGSPRGVMATFDNLTVVEKKNAHLRKLLQKLKNSRATIHQQNQALRTLATRDPLTDCLNRRAFFETFESHWTSAERYGTPLGCVMVDIDHFKSINDRHGHATGDQVLQHVAKILNSMMRKSDVTCRYGGEEFCILLPQVNLAGAFQAAERIRQTLAAHECAGVKVTASLGVAEIGLGALDPRELLNQADIALYAAKREGRNRVVCWNANLQHQEKGTPDTRHTPPRDDPQRSGTRIPFHTVTGLVSALGYRHADTAEHSRRVADLCVAAANGLLSQSECYVLEVAALLHDIGKLGVPDAVLLKPGPLDEQEWKIIRTHEGMGEAIITSAFSCDPLTEIVCKHHCWYGGSPRDPSLPMGDDIPLGARLLSIADAYDAMISDRVYRKGLSRDAAFAELRRCAGTQFDPVLVERFIDVAVARDDCRTPPISVSKQTALKVGVQIEKLAYALDAGDYGSLALMANYLNATANQHDIPPIAAAAARLERSAAAHDSDKITRTTIELLDLCRATYRSYLPTASA
jgi:diguanylate cyclase (GGDEF)-like protein